MCCTWTKTTRSARDRWWPTTKVFWDNMLLKWLHRSSFLVWQHFRMSWISWEWAPMKRSEQKARERSCWQMAYRSVSRPVGVTMKGTAGTPNTPDCCRLLNSLDTQTTFTFWVYSKGR